MAQQVTVRLSRSDASPWGFRLQGGKDFGQQLLIQKVNGGSLAEKAGLQVGDALIKVNTTEVYNMKHKEAQDTIVRSGNSFEITVQRGGQTLWKPQVSAVGSLPSPGGMSPQNVTKTSLAKPRQPPAAPIGSGHNASARPFGAAMNGGDSVKAIVNKQYNTPVGMYSEETIAETLSAQAEVLAGGVLGVNFKKNERTYDSQKSEVYKMVQEVDKEPRDPEPENIVNQPIAAPVTGLRHVAPPEARPPGSPQTLAPGQNICADCERLIVGVFVRIKDKNLHVECFKCATCGTSLKNVGYYNINNKLYCDIHAKLVARQNPPAPNLDPITIPPGAKVPSGAFTSPAVPFAAPAVPFAAPAVPFAAPAVPNLGSPAPQSPQPSTLGPLPFHAPRLGTSHVSVPRLGFQTPSAPAGGPKPFSAPAPAPAPVVAPPVSMPFSAPSAPISNIPKPQAPGFSTIKPMTNMKGGGRGSSGSTSAPRRGRGVLNAAIPPGGRIPVCGHCSNQIRGPFITALGKIWCPEHFLCVNAKCRRQLQDIGFVEESEGLYCEFCFEQYLAPTCSKCNSKIKGDCLNAIGKQFHPECFACAYCGKLFGNNPFFLEDALPYCEADWNELFTTKCFSCGFPIEAGDRWVEALNNNYHSQCFNCTTCKKNLEGESFFAKGGRPFCKNHVR